MMIFLAVMLCSCQDRKIEYNYPKTNTEKQIDKTGSLVTDEPGGGFSLFTSGSRKGGASNPKVNNYLWRAAIEAVSFMPLSSTDSSGGVIITDWFIDKNHNSSEKFKMNIMIMDSELTPNSFKVSIFKQVKKNGQWFDADVSEALKEEFEKKILTRARELKIVQNQ